MEWKYLTLSLKFTYTTNFVTTVRVKKIRRLVDGCIQWLHLENSLYLLKKEKRCWRCRGEKSESEYNDWLHTDCIERNILTIFVQSIKMWDMKKDCFQNSIKIKF